MSVLLAIFYYVIGLIMAFFWASTAGLVLCIPVALFRLFRHGRNVLLLLMYATGTALCGGILFGVGRLTETVATRTDHAVYWMLFVGMTFPGLAALGVIPAYIGIALRQTSGLIDPADA